MSRGQKTPPETIYKIISSYAITHNYKETSRETGVAVSTVKKIVDDNIKKPEFERLCNEKKSEFAENASRIMSKAMTRLEEDIENREKDIPVNHLTTVVGTLFDKKTLAEGKSTSKVTVEVIMPKGFEEYAE